MLCFLTAATSCKKGGLEDNIQLSQKNISLNKSMNSFSVTTKGKNWWIADVMMDSSHLYLKQIAIDSTLNYCNAQYADSNIQIVRSHCDTLQVKVNENKTNVLRRFYIQLEDGDYFDGITITQDK